MNIFMPIVMAVANALGLIISTTTAIQQIITHRRNRRRPK